MYVGAEKGPIVYVYYSSEALDEYGIKGLLVEIRRVIVLLGVGAPDVLRLGLICICSSNVRDVQLASRV